MSPVRFLAMPNRIEVRQGNARIGMIFEVHAMGRGWEFRPESARRRLQADTLDALKQLIVKEAS